MTSIHSTAIVHPRAQLGQNVIVGPYAIVDENVVLGDNVEIKAHANITGNTTIGAHSVIYPFASIGTEPQHLRYKGEPSTVKIGEHNTIREYVTVNRGTEIGSMETKIGDHNLIMIGSHVAHDCRIGNNVIIANSVQLGGHVTVENNVFIGGVVGVHQFVRIGQCAMIGGHCALFKDMLPFTIGRKTPLVLLGINVIGLRRKGFSREQISIIKDFFQKFAAPERPPLTELIDQELLTYPDDPNIRILHDFIKEPSRRGIGGTIASEEDDLF